MFRKLFKHEFLATWRILGAVVGLMVLVSGLLLVPAALKVPVLGMLAATLSMVGFCAIGPVVAIVLVVHYWRTMYGGQGYLTHSLPVRGRAVFAAKASYSCLMVALGLVVGVLLDLTLPAWAEPSLGEATAGLGRLLAPGQLVLFGAGLLVYCLCLYVGVLGAITLGTRGRFNRLGAGGAVLAFVIMYVVVEIVMAVSFLFLPLSLTVTGPHPGGLVFRRMDLAFVSDSTAAPDLIGLGWWPVAILVAVVMSVLAVRSIERHTCLR